mgnify:CR=1 FL=1
MPVTSLEIADDEELKVVLLALMGAESRYSFTQDYGKQGIAESLRKRLERQTGRSANDYARRKYPFQDGKGKPSKTRLVNK